jgi:hypothetical protein
MTTFDEVLLSKTPAVDSQGIEQRKPDAPMPTQATQEPTSARGDIARRGTGGSHFTLGRHSDDVISYDDLPRPVSFKSLNPTGNWYLEVPG